MKAMIGFIKNEKVFCFGTCHMGQITDENCLTDNRALSCNS